MYHALTFNGYSNFINATKFGQNPLKDVDSSVHKDVTERRKDGWTVALLYVYPFATLRENHDYRNVSWEMICI
jgi:hypothetical protein